MIAFGLRFCTALAAAFALSAGSARAAEVIRELDAEGRVRVIREVAEDAAGNCVNNGLWQLVAVDGRVCGEGRYEMGRRTGEWRRWLLAAEDVPPALGQSLRGFELPFLSRATFAEGQLEGAWTISDGRGRSCLSIELENGVRHGELRARGPAGQLTRSETYDRGRLEGRAFGWSDAAQRLIHTATWMKGYRVVRSASYYEDPAHTKRAEGDYLIGPQLAAVPDDFWAGRPAEYCIGSECIPHGQWRQWFAGGQLAAEGRYAWGRPTGAFVWRHPNGQKAASGLYAADGRPAGEWRWWNADGGQLAVHAIGLPSVKAEQPAQIARQTAPVDPTAVR